MQRRRVDEPREAPQRAWRRQEGPAAGRHRRLLALIGPHAAVTLALQKVLPLQRFRLALLLNDEAIPNRAPSLMFPLLLVLLLVLLEPLVGLLALLSQALLTASKRRTVAFLDGALSAVQVNKDFRAFETVTASFERLAEEVVREANLVLARRNAP